MSAFGPWRAWLAHAMSHHEYPAVPEWPFGDLPDASVLA